jgi:hypothetical protein
MVQRVIPRDQRFVKTKVPYWYYLDGSAVWRFDTGDKIDLENRKDNYYQSELECMKERLLITPVHYVKKVKRRLGSGIYFVDCIRYLYPNGKVFRTTKL